MIFKYVTHNQITMKKKSSATDASCIPIVGGS